MADDGAQEAKIAEFSAVTGADSDRAKFFLESSNWQIQVALDQFFDNSGDAAFEDASADMPEEIPVVADPPPPSQASDTAPAGRKTTGSRIATMSDMMRDEPDNNSSDEEGQAYYAGGSDHGTGQQVVGPKKKKGEKDSLVNNLFKQAKEHGAQEVSAGAPVSGEGQSSSYVFRGAAYRLGESENDSVQPIPGTAGTMPEKPPEQRHVVLKLWKNGFSIDDGELRDYKDTKNAAILNSISKGEIPMELIREAKGGEVNLDMEDHRSEEYVRPKKKVKPFAGQGYMLGSPTPNVVSSPATGASASAGSSSTDNKGNERSANESIGLDTSQPVTNVQLRLGDGTRLVGKFNHTHTVGDIRSYISLARPTSAGLTYVLMTTFPNKELTDDSQSLADAKLLNAVIVQRIK